MLTGILLLVCTSILWVVQGAVISMAAEKKLNLSAIQTLAALVIMCLTLPFSAVAGPPDRLTFLSLTVAGFANCGAYQLMNLAMKNGPHGMTWAISQSAFAIPFLMGITLFDVPCPAVRGVSLAMLVASMIVMGIFGKKDDSGCAGGKVRWAVCCLCAYIVIGISQCGGSLPSYFVNDSVSTAGNVLVRVGVLGIGIFAGGLFNLAFFERTPVFKPGFTVQSLLLTSAMITANLLAFKAFDIISINGAGAISYPIVTGLSIAFFFIYTALKLKEKPSLPAILGILMCLAGIIGMIF